MARDVPIGLRYQGVFKFTSARARPACCSGTLGLNRCRRVKTVLKREYRLITVSRPTLPGKPVGFSHSHTKTAPHMGECMRGKGNHPSPKSGADCNRANQLICLSRVGHPMRLSKWARARARRPQKLSRVNVSSRVPGG